MVTPFAGVWIEIRSVEIETRRGGHSLRGVWIEIVLDPVNETVSLSLPSRECGLKLT